MTYNNEKLLDMTASFYVAHLRRTNKTEDLEYLERLAKGISNIIDAKKKNGIYDDNDNYDDSAKAYEQFADAFYA